ncbi:MAG: hypothetical protein AMXMBFR48_03980 [Ignavibacteriales bacterium]
MLDPGLSNRLLYSFAEHPESYALPQAIGDAFQIISKFFGNNESTKLCLVFPSKEFAAQWIIDLLILDLFQNDFYKYNKEIFTALKTYQKGDLLLLNDDAIIEWIGLKDDFFNFYYNAGKEKGEIGVSKMQILKLQPAPLGRTKLASHGRMKKAIYSEEKLPIERLLNIRTYGNRLFQKSKLCLVGKYNLFEKSKENILLNKCKFGDYYKHARIDEAGNVDDTAPLLLSNNLSNLSLFLIKNTVTKIVIDGVYQIQERITDFSDIEKGKFQTILITDLSEIETFETIENYGFEFFNFTKENLKLDHSANLSPFHSFEKKLRKYISFNVVKEICLDAELEATTKKIHSIEKDEYNNDLTSLKISLIQLANLVSRVAHIPTTEEISVLNSKINSIETLFLRCRMWLGEAHNPIEESISLLKSVIARFATQPSKKCARLITLMSSKQYDYIICSTEEEAKALDDSLPAHIQKPRVISVGDVNDKLLSSNPLKAILTGWVKSNNINRILSSFLFSEITVLFYQFENKYYNSLQRRNKQYSENIKATINSEGIRTEGESEKPKGFSNLYIGDEVDGTTSESSFDILDFEFKLDNAQYSRYAAKGNLIDSIKAKRIVFESDFFIYTTESHKFLVINELIERRGEKANLHRRKVESLQTGDVIALINTDRDILVELVEKNTNTKELASVKQWTELWKNRLKEYYASIGSDFKKLVEDLRKNDCKKHEVTIRTWLQDESRIGPDDNADLISIALLTNSNLLNDNINTVREAIRKMTGWRMKASDFITDKIKTQIHEFADSSIINKKISVEGLGSVIVLKVIEVSNVWENIDVRYVNRLLQKEII